MTKILAVSDVERPYLYRAVADDDFGDFDVIISCGDLPYAYLEYLISMSNRDLYFVRGNHAHKPEFSSHDAKNAPLGGIDLHRKTVHTRQGLVLAGIQGSLVYNYGPFQYSQAEMWSMVLLMVPKLLSNFMRYGRFLDIFVTHAPPWGIHDLTDRPHQGIRAFRWLIDVFHPTFHLHGHTRDYLQRTSQRTKVGKTEVMNVTGCKLIDFQRRD